MKTACSLTVILLLVGAQDAPEPVIDGYTDYAAFVTRARGLGVKVETLAKTLGGREVLALTIGSGEMDGKPGILIVGSAYGPHILGSELALRMAAALSKKPELLERVTFYVIPRPNPDATEAFFAKPWMEREGNLRKTDDDRDGEVGEDPPEDLNGDGFITMMRVEDESGGWMPHKDDPRVMVKADAKKNEVATHAVYVEGRDNDGDESWNEDSAGGVSFNRNFTYNYPYFRKGAGRHQVSEKETRAVADFAFAKKNIAVVLSFTPEDNLLHVWKADKAQKKERIKTAVLEEDEPYFKYVSEQYQELHGGKDAPKPPKGEGSFAEWAYYHYGRWSFAARGWWIPKSEELPEAIKWMDENKVEGFVPWAEIEHPDFPDRKVEVGGFKPFSLLNPPASELDGLAEKHTSFAEKLAGWLPKLKIGEPKVESLGEGLHRLTVPVVNTGYFRTHPEMGNLSRKHNPLQIRIDLQKGVTLSTGNLRETVPSLDGNGGKKEITWLLVAEAAAEVTVTVYSPSVGSVSKKIQVKE